MSVFCGFTQRAIVDLNQKSLVVFTAVSPNLLKLSQHVNCQTCHCLRNRDTHFYLQLDDLSRGLDYLVQRRLEITAQYDLSCSILADNVIRSTVQVTADSHSAGLISTICKQGKYTGRLYHSPHSKYFSFSCLQTELHFQCPVTMNCDTKGW